MIKNQFYHFEIKIKSSFLRIQNSPEIVIQNYKMKISRNLGRYIKCDGFSSRF